MAGPTFYCNGVDAETGGYSLPPVSAADLAILARRGSPGGTDVADAGAWLAARRSGRRGLAEGDPKDLAQSGWGVLFAASDPQAPAIREALQELLDHRRAQASAQDPRYYQEYLGDPGYQVAETKGRFLARHGVGPGPAEPARMPYYLLIVGDPAAVPYEFQYQLDVPYAVGRLSFETLDDYATYARNVVRAETTAAATASDTPLRVALFGPRHPDDPGTILTSTELVAPLAESLGSLAGCEIRTALADDATKARLGSFLGGAEAADLLFTAGHGIVLPNGSPRQPLRQGALLCQGWPGAKAWHEPLNRDHYFAAEDLDPACRLDGLIAFHFACYSGGSPAWDDFAPTVHERVPVSPYPFVARLPQRLLAAGALAVVGHIEKAWECSVDWPGVGPQIQVFERTLKKLLSGSPIGAAMECFAERYAELSTELNGLLQDLWRGDPQDDEALASLWKASNDARNYVVLGDPAVRLRSPKEETR
jgi:hypothetical protein